MKVKIHLEELKKKNIIYIESIQEGFNKYPNTMLDGSEEQVNTAIRQLFNINGLDNSYADFYYGRLNQQEKNRVQAALDEKEVMVIESLQLSTDDIFIQLNSELLEILLKLTANEVLFSSFYFAKYPCLVWGNYGKRYPVFFKDDSVMQIVIQQIWKRQK
ncbi:hypothetical protein [Clostridium vincentii]|uniref:Uncharacterized protein n=1 Tax=Clostridium vincentii TaxID=52704 RepID=A0A2T0BCS4_9CLOT|nr:hypothetical protein [Clostridium vincentii]PRR81633.1 hypothetical protein CLVI_23580 [Clostridium vincentii]